MDVKACISQSLEELLDKMTFMSFEETYVSYEESLMVYVDKAPPQLPPGALITELEFEGLIDGVVNIGFAPLAAEHITRNFLGLTDDEDLDLELMQDGVREFTNILIGRMLILANPDFPHHMELPRLVSKMQTSTSDDQVIRIHGELDEDPCVVQILYSLNEEG